MVGMAMSALLASAFLVMGFLPTSSAWLTGRHSSCPPGFAQSPRVPKCYRFVLILRSWEEAREQCLAERGVLLQLANRAEIHALVALANQENVPIEIGSPAVHFWTGGRRVGSSFKWDASGKALPRGSPLWHKGEPNNAGGDEYYTEVYLSDEAHESAMNDIKQSKKFFICEAPLRV
nr:C-type lectin domain-containing type 1 protein 1 [Arenicola marina]